MNPNQTSSIPASPPASPPASSRISPQAIATGQPLAESAPHLHILKADVPGRIKFIPDKLIPKNYLDQLKTDGTLERLSRTQESLLRRMLRYDTASTENRIRVFQKSLARDMRLSEDHVRQLLKALAALGVILIEGKQGREKKYRFLRPGPGELPPLPFEQSSIDAAQPPLPFPPPSSPPRPESEITPEKISGETGENPRCQHRGKSLVRPEKISGETGENLWCAPVRPHITELEMNSLGVNERKNFSPASTKAPAPKNSYTRREEKILRQAMSPEQLKEIGL